MAGCALLIVPLSNNRGPAVNQYSPARKIDLRSARPGGRGAAPALAVWEIRGMFRQRLRLHPRAELHARRYTQQSKYRDQVIPHRVVRDVQAAGDLLVGLAQQDELHDVVLSPG